MNPYRNEIKRRCFNLSLNGRSFVGYVRWQCKGDRIGYKGAYDNAHSTIYDRIKVKSKFLVDDKTRRCRITSTMSTAAGNNNNKPFLQNSYFAQKRQSHSFLKIMIINFHDGDSGLYDC